MHYRSLLEAWPRHYNIARLRSDLEPRRHRPKRRHCVMDLSVCVAQPPTSGDGKDKALSIYQSRPVG